MRKPKAEILAVLLGLGAVVVWLQVRNGAYLAELTTPDESAHFVTALMIRDYIANGFPGTPMAFAVDYYLHYPKVAFGSWPPLFHVMQAALLLVWNSKAAVIALGGLINAVVATMLFSAARRFWGRWASIALALFFVSLPLSQYLASRVLADGLVGVFDLASLFALVKYVEGAQRRDALWFGFLAGLSMLAKQNGVAMLAVPLVAIPLAGKLDLFKRRDLWLGLGLGVLLGGPLVAYSARIFTGTDPHGNPESRLSLYLSLFGHELGLAIMVLAGVGAVTVFVRRHVDPARGFWSVMIAFAFVAAIFHAFTPNTPAPRYLWPAFPGIVLLAGEGIVRIAKWLRVRASALQVVLTGGVAGVLIAGPFAPVYKARLGFDAVAEQLASAPNAKRSAIFVSSRKGRDGLFIAEVAIRDNRPQHYVLRADKILSSSDWIGGRYQLKYSSTVDVDKVLMSIPIAFVVIDDAGVDSLPHHELLKATIKEYQSDWKRVLPSAGVYPEGCEVFENMRVPHEPVQPFEVEMKYSLGLVLKHK